MKGDLFTELALALHGPRGSGRSTRMIDHAPQRATVLACDNTQDLKRLIEDRGRKDLTVLNLSPDEDRIRGISGPFVIDHLAIERMFHQARRIINDQEREIAALKTKLAASRRYAAEIMAASADPGDEK